MTPKPLIAILVLAVLLLVVALPAVAQSASPPSARPNEPALPPPRKTRRITIYPGPLLYRRCTDWYELQDRPSGRVLYPQMRCWWVRG